MLDTENEYEGFQEIHCKEEDMFSHTPSYYEKTVLSLLPFPKAFLRLLPPTKTIFTLLSFKQLSFLSSVRKQLSSRSSTDNNVHPSAFSDKNPSTSPSTLNNLPTFSTTHDNPASSPRSRNNVDRRNPLSYEGTHQTTHSNEVEQDNLQKEIYKNISSIVVNGVDDDSQTKTNSDITHTSGKSS